MNYRLLLVAGIVALMLVAVACGGGGDGSEEETPNVVSETSTPLPVLTPDPLCAGGTGPEYAGLLTRVAWTFYCPSFLPEGAVLEDANFTFIAGRGVSTIKFRLPDGKSFDIIQGAVGIVPRNERELPIVEPVRAVFFADIVSELFATMDEKPLVLSAAAAEVTRAVAGSSEMDPEIVVAVAEGMHPLR